MNVEIAQRLAELRRKKGYSQETLARELGLSRQAVSKWERAESSPDTENLIMLAKLYGVSLDELLDVDAELVDDVAFESEERQRADAKAAAERERAAADVAQAHETAVRAAAAAVEASKAAAQAATVATSAGSHQPAAASKDAKKKGRWRSFPYWVVATILFFVISRFNGLWALSVWLTIPIYNWVASILDEEETREKVERAGSRPEAGNLADDKGADGETSGMGGCTLESEVTDHD